MTFDPTKVIWAAAITVWNPISAAEETFYVATRNAFTLHSGAASETQFSIRLDQPALASRTAFQDHRTTGRGQVSVGNVVLNNAGGFFDAYLGYGFDGRAIVISMGQTSGVYPDSFTTVLDVTMESALFGQEDVTITLRDWSRAANVPLQTSTYGGTNALPAGLDGTSDLAGKAKPVLLGTVRNLEPVCVNTSKLIYQINDGSVASIDAVYDEGVSLASSVDSWTSRTSGFGTTSIRGLAYGSSIYVAVGAAGTLTTSTDRSTWTARTSGFVANRINDIAFGNGVFVTVGEAGNLFTSSDGITWTSRTSTFGATEIFRVAYVNSLWIACGASGKLATSTDAITWTSRTSTITNEIRGIAYGVIGGVGRYVIVGGGPVGAGSVSEGATSTNGTSWTTNASLAEVATPYMQIVFGGGLFVATTFTGSSISTSVDGLVFSTRASGQISAKSIQNVAYDSITKRFLFTGGTLGKAAVASSRDASVWQLRSTGSVNEVRAVLAMPDGGFMVGDDGAGLFTSSQVTTFASLADLQDDTLAPAPGTYKTYLAGGYLRLGSSPAGRITATASQGATSSNRTAAQLFTTVLQRAGFGVLNQLLYSQAFDNAAWSKTNVTVTADNTTAPDGTTTADKIAATATAATAITQSVTASASAATYSLYIKQGSGATQANNYGIRNATTSTNLLFVSVNLSTGAITYGAGTTGALVTSAGSGWWRLSLTVTSGITNGDALTCYAGFVGNSETAGVFSYDWGAQFNAGNQILDYTPTTSAAVIGGDWKTTDITTLDTATSAECGYYSTTGDQVMCADVVDQIADAVGAWWSTDAQGIIRIKRLANPDTNIVLQPDSLATSPWVSTGSQSVSNAVAVYDGVSYSRVSGNDGTSSLGQGVTLTGNGAKIFAFRVKYDGHAGSDVKLLYDNTAVGALAAVQIAYASDGTASFTLLTGQSLTAVQMPSGAYSVRVVSNAATAAHTHVVYAADAGGWFGGVGVASSFLASGLHVYDATPAALVTQDTDMDGMQQVQSADDTGGVPVYRTVVRASKNYAPLTGTDLAGSVSDADRATFGALFLDSGTTADASVQTAHPLSSQTVKETLLSATSDASTEATRLQTLFGSQRAWFDVPVYLTDTTAAIELGDVIELQSTRFGLGAGTRVVVMGIHPDAQTQRTILSVWR